MYVLHPWHGAHYGDNSPQTVNGLIEIPQGSRTKYEIDKTTGLLKLDRIIYSSFHYPINYGFIPQTLGLDGDPLDILVMCSESIQPLCLVEATVIGNMQMIDTGVADDKIIAVATKDPGVNYITSVDELPKHFIVLVISLLTFLVLIKTTTLFTLVKYSLLIEVLKRGISLS